MLKNFFISFITLLILARLVPGFIISDWYAAVIAVIIIGLINITIKPILTILALPITILTLGIFSFILNALLLLLAAYLTPGFNIDTFLTAIIASFLFSVITSLFFKLLP